MEKRPALGKGLSALIPDAPEPRIVADSKSTSIGCRPNAFSRAATMDDARLDELARSIKSNGVIQPIVVRKVGDRFQIIAGERRWRAAQKAGLLRVPVVVRDVRGRTGAVAARDGAIENIQRENLNPIDEALAYRRLADEFHLTQEDIAAAVGKDRASVANYLRLLKLPDEVRAEVASGHAVDGPRAGAAGACRPRPISAGWRATSSPAACRCAKPSRWSRRSSRRGRASRARRRRSRRRSHPRRRGAAALALGTRVRIVRQGERGRIEIDFGSEDELIRLFEQLTERGD